MEVMREIGHVIELRIIIDKLTGHSRGFGFCTYTKSEDAENAVRVLNGRMVHGRTIRVCKFTSGPRHRR